MPLSLASEINPQRPDARGEFLSFEQMADRQPAPPIPFRPVQFLGAKTRVLDALAQATSDHVQPGAHVLDLFTGSSVVAQTYARAGLRVSATDALRHCVHFATALLGIGRVGRSADTLTIVRAYANDELAAPWGRWLKREADAVAGRDADTLTRLAQAIPQCWRPAHASPALRQTFDSLVPGERTELGLVAAHYAGSYFGINQAIEIDRIRLSIARARAARAIDSWTESALLTALLSAASECAFSAGKHYAQPHRIRPGKDLSFIRSRILADRSKNVGALFEDRIDRITRIAAAAGDGHTAKRWTLEELRQDPNRLRALDAVYADPPYTAQQYSRFYHAPEVICDYRVPALQVVGGRVTRGLYPANRFKSRFCSRRLAADAFRDLCDLARHHDALLFLSYSASTNGKTGNERSISLRDLRGVLRAAFGPRVEERELPITYRQFNSTSASVRDRADVELLFIAGRNA